MSKFVYAITPHDIGNLVGVRCIEDGWPLRAGETFTVASVPPNAALAGDGVSLVEGADVKAAADAKNDAILQLQAIDLQSIRSLREWLVMQPTCPKFLKDHEAAAQAERTKLK